MVGRRNVGGFKPCLWSVRLCNSGRNRRSQSLRVIGEGKKGEKKSEKITKEGELSASAGEVRAAEGCRVVANNRKKRTLKGPGQQRPASRERIGGFPRKGFENRPYVGGEQK